MAFFSTTLGIMIGNSQFNIKPTKNKTLFRVYVYYFFLKHKNRIFNKFLFKGLNKTKLPSKIATIFDFKD